MLRGRIIQRRPSMPMRPTRFTAGSDESRAGREGGGLGTGSTPAARVDCRARAPGPAASRRAAARSRARARCGGARSADRARAAPRRCRGLAGSFGTSEAGWRAGLAVGETGGLAGPGVDDPDPEPRAGDEPAPSSPRHPISSAAATTQLRAHLMEPARRGTGVRRRAPSRSHRSRRA